MSFFDNQEFNINGGGTVLIRTAFEKDAKEMLDLAEEVLEEEIYSISTLDEFQISIEQEKNIIRTYQEDPRSLFLVAEFNGEIVGMLNFQSPKQIRLSHQGHFGMSVTSKMRGMGIGKALVTSLLNWTANHPEIEKVCLQVLSNNNRAKRMYESLGFEEEGRRVAQVKFGENSYVDDVLMYKFV